MRIVISADANNEQHDFELASPPGAAGHHIGQNHKPGPRAISGESAPTLLDCSATFGGQKARNKDCPVISRVRQASLPQPSKIHTQV